VDIGIIEERIEELEHYKKKVVEQIADLKREKDRIAGGIEEMWKWHAAQKSEGEFGTVTFDGKKKIHKLPTLGSAKAIQDALERREGGVAIEGEGPEEARARRVKKARSDSQLAVDVLDGESPFTSEKEKSPTEPVSSEQPQSDATSQEKTSEESISQQQTSEEPTSHAPI
jgi:hypothetical protein